jgi:type IX secretion system PorP/SprF family membrane protein
MTIVGKRKIRFIILIAVLPFCAYAQDVAIYNHYFANPFFYNPSYSNSSSRSEISFLYRQQFTGIEGAPKFANVTLTAPLSNKMGFGLNLSNNQRGVITTTSIQFSISYKAQFSKQTYLSFGISAGPGINGLDKNKVDANDPLVVQLLSTSVFLDGQVGFNFQLKNLNLGLSIPQIFDRTPANSSSFQKIGLNPFNLAIASISYKATLSENLSFQPLFMTKILNNSSQWEAYGIAYYKDMLYLGGMYRQNYGAAGLLGFKINDFFKIGYSYEFPIDASSDISFNSHEVRLSLYLGNTKVDKEKINKSIPYPSYKRTNHYKKTHHKY